MTQVEALFYEIEKRGGRITTYELMNLQPRISQYQARLKQLRENLAEKGIVLTLGEPIKNDPRNHLYQILKPKPQQHELSFEAA